MNSWLGITREKRQVLLIRDVLHRTKTHATGTHTRAHAFISVDGNVTPGENVSCSTQPSFSLNSRRRTASFRRDGSGGAGARRKGYTDTNGVSGWSRERGEKSWDRGRRLDWTVDENAGETWEAFDEESFSDEWERVKRREDRVSSDGHSILYVANFTETRHLEFKGCSKGSTIFTN